MNGALIVTEILKNPALFQDYKTCLVNLVKRLKEMRKTLKELLISMNCPPPNGLPNWNHLIYSVGMFCITGINEEQSKILKNDYHIYMGIDGRISISGLNSKNIS